MTATALLLFVASSFQYQGFSFFKFLLFSRIFMVGLGYSLSVALWADKIRVKKIETYYFLFCLTIQAIHGIIEGSDSIAFYSFTGPWFVLCSLSLQETFVSWLKTTFPFQFLGFVLPLFFKDSHYFLSVGSFVDSFSLPVSGMVIGLILAKITSDRYDAINEKLKLERKLNEVLARDLDREIIVRSMVENELAIAKIEIEKSAELRAMTEMASQVSHDIRSPLSALNLILGQLDSIAEEKRVLIRSSVNRINDIANSLLAKGKCQNISSENEVILFASLVDSLVSEKRIQFRESSQIEIEADLLNSYGIFASVNQIELKRALSNLINNAVEAFSDSLGRVELFLNNIGDEIHLIVKDNGRGIPPEVLERIGQRGASYGKEGTSSGSGLGVYHARKTIEACGGKFEIQSEISKGTSVIMRFKKEVPPNWFVTRISIKPGQDIVAIDDDSSILEVWKQKFSNAIDKYDLNLLTCSSGICLRSWVEKNQARLKEALFLIDYEFVGHIYNGLDLVEELKIGSNAILVTSRYDEVKVKSRCERLGVRLIPKGMASLVPIEIESKLQKVDCILIDNDPLIEMTWKFAAKERGMTVSCFANEASFFESMVAYDCKTPVFVDVDLGNNVKGQDVASRIFAAGFSNINLATGYSIDQIDRPNFIKTVVGKDFPLKLD